MDEVSKVCMSVCEYVYLICHLVHFQDIWTYMKMTKTNVFPFWNNFIITLNWSLFRNKKYLESDRDFRMHLWYETHFIHEGMRNDGNLIYAYVSV